MSLLANSLMHEFLLFISTIFKIGKTIQNQNNHKFDYYIQFKKNHLSVAVSVIVYLRYPYQ